MSAVEQQGLFDVTGVATPSAQARPCGGQLLSTARTSDRWEIQRIGVHVVFDVDHRTIVDFPGYARRLRLLTLDLSDYPDGHFGVWVEARPLDHNDAEQFTTYTRGWWVSPDGQPLGSCGVLSESLLAIVDEVRPGWWPSRVTNPVRHRTAAKRGNGGAVVALEGGSGP